MSKWRVEISKDALKFLVRNNIPKSIIFGIVKDILDKFSGVSVNVDVKRLKRK